MSGTAAARVRTRRKPIAPASDGTPLTIPSCDIHPQATALLAEVLARLHDVEQAVIQFIAAAPDDSHRSPVSLQFAVACVAKLGRTLLLSPASDAQVSGSHALSFGARSTTRGGSSLVPNTHIPGLYHRRIDDAPFEPALLASPGGKAGSKPFRMVVLCSPSPSVCPASLAQSARCHGSILTVQAGVTSLASIRTAVRQVQHAGGTVLGTVLVDAPRLPWPFTPRRIALAE